jgi:hypothetical protein
VLGEKKKSANLWHSEFHLLEEPIANIHRKSYMPFHFHNPNLSYFQFDEKYVMYIPPGMKNSSFIADP